MHSAQQSSAEQYPQGQRLAMWVRLGRRNWPAFGAAAAATVAVASAKRCEFTIKTKRRSVVLNTLKRNRSSTFSI